MDVKVRVRAMFKKGGMQGRREGGRERGRQASPHCLGPRAAHASALPAYRTGSVIKSRWVG